MGKQKSTRRRKALPCGDNGHRLAAREGIVPRSGPKKKCLPFYRLDKVKEAGAATKDAELFMSECSS
ncbi:MAG: hypothetical protein AAFN10_06850 [Bacteroidota bacterium]